MNFFYINSNNLFISGGGAPTGAKAGITRSVSNRIKVSTDPLVYVFDTPGIWTPYIPDIETGMKLALCGLFIWFLTNRYCST